MCYKTRMLLVGATPIVFTSEAAWMAALLSGSTFAVENFDTESLGEVVPSGTNLGLFTVT